MKMVERTKRVRLKWILRMGFCLALVAAMVLIGAVLAGAEEVKYSEGLKFTSNGDGTCSVSGIGTCTDTEIVIPSVSPDGDIVTYIGNNAFMHNRVTQVIIPKGVNGIGDYAFSYCYELTNVLFCENSQLISIGKYAFSSCMSLESIVIPESVTTIGNVAFAGCSNLANITLPNGLTRISVSMFEDCNSLVNITIPRSVTQMGEYAFRRCSSLINITVEKGNLTFHSEGNCLIHTDSKTLVYGCNNSIIPSDGSVTRIGDHAFSGRSTLEAIIIPEQVTQIGNEAFKQCDKLTNIIIHGDVTSIGRGAFAYCGNLSNITIPASLQYLGGDSFRSCRELESIVIPKGISLIRESTFGSCNNLKNIYFLGTCAEWEAITIESGNDPLLNATIHFLGEPTTPTASKLTSASVTLGDSLALNYYATLNPAHTAAQMRFTYHGETITVDGILDETTGEYKFTLGRIPPQCMGDNVKAELILVAEDGTETVLDVKESYSIRRYCDDALAANPNNEALATLLADLLAYGDAAQDYANYNEDTPVSEGFEVAPTEWEDVTDTDFTLSDKTRDDIRFTAAGVRFGYVNRIYFKIKAADLTGVTLTVNGKTYTAEDLTLAEDTADTYIFYTEAVYATEFDKVFTAELSADGEVIQTLTYSVKSYVCTKQNSNDTEIAALVKALYNYGRSAIAYKNAQ